MPGRRWIDFGRVMIRSYETGVTLRSRTLPRSGAPSCSGVGAGSGELDSRRLEALDSAEHESAVLLVDDHRLTDPELLPEDLLRKRVLYELLDRTAQGSCPELRRVSLSGDEPLGGSVSSRPMPWPSS